MKDKVKHKGHMWVAVANRTGMKVFRYENPSNGVSLVHNIEHPEGYLKDTEMGTGKPGRSFDRFGTGRHGMGTHQSMAEHVSETFAKHLAKVLDEARMKNEFSELVLIAEAGFLGLLRKNLSASTSHAVVHSLHKDLGKLPQHELEAYLLGPLMQELTNKVKV